MSSFDPHPQPPQQMPESDRWPVDEEPPARRLLAHDQETWQRDEDGDGWTPVD